jgi:hypothetical protein
MGKLQTAGLAVLMGLSLVGCGGGDSEVKHPDRTKVSGTVTMNGAPVEGATVTLHPVQKGNAAFGITNASGKYQLGTFEKTDGAIPGEYKVSIQKMSAGDTGPQPAPGDPGYNPNAKPEASKNLLPEQFADYTKSGLSASVTTTANDALNFDLK